MFPILHNKLLLSLFLGRRKNLGGHTQINAVVQFVIPNLAVGSRLAVDALLAGLVVGQRFGTGGDAAFANVGHLINGFVVFVTL